MGPGNTQKTYTGSNPKAASGEPIPLYGDGLNVRDW